MIRAEFKVDEAAAALILDARLSGRYSVAEIKKLIDSCRRAERLDPLFNN